jgi:hypothetical protein
MWLKECIVYIRHKYWEIRFCIYRYSVLRMPKEYRYMACSFVYY